MELWIQRAGHARLSFQNAKPLKQRPEWTPIHPLILLPLCNYTSPLHRHLALLLPKLSQCERIDIRDWNIPHGLAPSLHSPSLLQSLSVVVGYSNFEATAWFSGFLVHAPLLSRLHWQGPPLQAPWMQLVHFSWHPSFAEMDRLGDTLDQLTSETHLRLDLGWSIIPDLPQSITPRTIANVTAFFFGGQSLSLCHLILPRLNHLVLELSVHSNPERLRHFLDMSACTIECLEVQQDHSDSSPPFLLSHACVTSSLTRLLLSSWDLNNFFMVSGILPIEIRMLHPVDRCFRIEGEAFGGTTGMVSGILRSSFPALEQLDLDDNSEVIKQS